MPRKLVDSLVRHEEPDARAYLAAIVDSSEDAILSKDLNGVITSCNAAAERIFGYTPDELIGQPVLILIPPERHQEETHILSRVRAGERVGHFETVRVRKDGRRIDVSLTVSAVRDATGRIIGASKVARDITEAKRAVAALRAQEAWFRVTLNSIADAVIASDPAGIVTYINAAASTLTGWSTAEAVGQPLEVVFPILDERTRRPTQNSANLGLTTGGPATSGSHALLVARDGHELPIADSAAPIRDADGRILGVVLAFRDVGPQRAEAAARQQAEAERERLLGAERSARAEAERASRIKDEFVAMVSHELRTPLNAILGWTQLMARSPGDVALLERGLDVVARNTRVQAQLVSDLLDISRIVEGKLTLEVRTLDVGAVVADAIDTVAREAAERGLVVRRRLTRTPIFVAGDPGRLQQIVWNLLSNAIKFTPSHGEIVVSLKSGGDHVEIAVADSGSGIRPEVLPHIFDRFHQADRSITRRFGGLGLGLAIVKHLVELHGGQVRVDSPGEGLGSTFTVTLPASSTPPLTPAGQPSTAAMEIAAPVTLAGVRVLVVEDEPDTLQFLKRLFESHGAEVVTAATAAEAQEVFSHERIGVLVSDIGLPGVDGYELMREIRRLSPDGQAVPAIALTAYARAEDRTRALRAGYQAHVTKPVDGAELMAMVASLLELTRRPDGGRAGKPSSTGAFGDTA
jgi:PAS domain S-box-containing protein